MAQKPFKEMELPDIDGKRTQAKKYFDKTVGILENSTVLCIILNFPSVINIFWFLGDAC